MAGRPPGASRGPPGCPMTPSGRLARPMSRRSASGWSKGGLVTRFARLLSSLGLILAIASAGALALAARGSLGVSTGAGGASVSAQDSGITVEFLGWSHYRLTSPSGKVVVTNPYITNNPDAAVTLDEALAKRTDII